MRARTASPRCEHAFFSAGVSRMLGHANVAVTAAVYCHHLAGQDQAAIARLEAFIDTPVSAAPTTGTLVSLAERRARGGR